MKLLPVERGRRLWKLDRRSLRDGLIAVSEMSLLCKGATTYQSLFGVKDRFRYSVRLV